jgi:chromosome segregation ATPase
MFALSRRLTVASGAFAPGQTLLVAKKKTIALKRAAAAMKSVAAKFVGKGKAAPAKKPVASSAKATTAPSVKGARAAVQSAAIKAKATKDPVLAAAAAAAAIADLKHQHAQELRQARVDAQATVQRVTGDAARVAQELKAAQTRVAELTSAVEQQKVRGEAPHEARSATTATAAPVVTSAADTGALVESRQALAVARAAAEGAERQRADMALQLAEAQAKLQRAEAASAAVDVVETERRLQEALSRLNALAVVNERLEAELQRGVGPLRTECETLRTELAVVRAQLRDTEARLAAQRRENLPMALFAYIGVVLAFYCLVKE